ncbi:MAG: hypothetical protein IIA50_01820 [Bacteroidetes bacterium]|nr:hypothetical protein [Bacteroidota bacterium]
MGIFSRADSKRTLDPRETLSSRKSLLIRADIFSATAVEMNWSIETHSVSTQNQALNQLVFLYRYIVGIELDDFGYIDPRDSVDHKSAG